MGSEEGIRSPGTGAIDSCEPPYGCWQQNTGPVQEQVLLTTEPSLQSPPCLEKRISKLRSRGYGDICM